MSLNTGETRMIDNGVPGDAADCRFTWGSWSVPSNDDDVDDG